MPQDDATTGGSDHSSASNKHHRSREQALTQRVRELEERLADHEARTEHLRQGEQCMQLLAKYTKDLLSCHTADGRYLYVSPACRAMLGYEPGELLGKSAFDGIHPDDVSAVRQLNQQMVREEVSQPVVFRKQRKDGSYLHVEVTVRGVRDPKTGELSKIVAITRDIADRRATEESLRLVQSAVKQIDEAVVITEAELDPPGPRIEYVNPAFTRMTGYTADEVRGRTPRLLQGPRTSRAVLDRLRECLSRGEPFEGETINYRKDGSEFMLHWHISPIRDERGRTTHWVAIQRDVTERRKEELFARQRQAELAHFGRLSTMGELASELAHELNQPLAAIDNYAQGARRRLKETAMDTPALIDVFKHIAAQADRASQIIRRLRRFVRKREPQRTATNANEIARDVVELIGPELRQHSVQVQFELDESLPSVMVDPVQIQQVLLNLMRNAIEAMASLPTASRLLRLTSQLTDRHEVQIHVIDQGPGIPEHQLPHIFEPFFTTRQRGMGMGLPISLSITKAHGGRLEAHRSPKGGMDFRLILPTKTDDKCSS